SCRKATRCISVLCSRRPTRPSSRRSTASRCTEHAARRIEREDQAVSAAPLAATRVPPRSRALTFDRASGRLEGANAIERVAAMAMQLGNRVTAPFHHRGFALGCRMLRVALPVRDIVVRLSSDSVFAFPFADGYWSRLLVPSDVYEPEIDAFL